MIAMSFRIFKISSYFNIYLKYIFIYKYNIFKIYLLLAHAPHYKAKCQKSQCRTVYGKCQNTCLACTQGLHSQQHLLPPTQNCVYIFIYMIYMHIYTYIHTHTYISQGVIKHGGDHTYAKSVLPFTLKNSIKRAKINMESRKKKFIQTGYTGKRDKEIQYP